MPEASGPLSDAEVARELAAIQASLATLAGERHSEAIATELATIRDTLRRLAEDNEEVRKLLGLSLGLRVDDDPPSDA